MNIIEQAFALAEAVDRFRELARRFFYQVVLSGHVCPRCGGGLVMVQESCCTCTACGQEFDPTGAFQRCSICRGRPRLAVRRYSCSRCGADVPSRFLFDGMVFDADYFRQKIAESRERKRELRERVRQMLAESRSGVIQPPPADLDNMTSLVEALNALTQGLEPGFCIQPKNGFDLKRYQSHILAHLQPFPFGLADIPPLSENLRKDRVWRFIAIIFLAHAGIVEIWQDGQEIMVRKNEADAKGQGIPGNLEAADGIRRVIC